MKHERLCAIGHNLADSMACGVSFVIGCHAVDVFGEAAASPDGVIEIDFLSGDIVRGSPSDSLRSAGKGFAKALPSFCRKNGAAVTDFQALSAVFDATPLGRRVFVTVVDGSGRRSITEYAGLPLKRPHVLDRLGRVRPLPRERSHLRQPPKG